MQCLHAHAPAGALAGGPVARAPHAGPSSRRRLVVAAAGSTYGTLFRVTTFGESHGKGVGCVVDGVPPRLAISEEEIQVHSIICSSIHVGAGLQGVACALAPVLSPAYHTLLTHVICASLLLTEGGARQAQARAEHHHHAPAGGGQGRDPEWRGQWCSPWLPHRSGCAQQGPAQWGGCLPVFYQLHHQPCCPHATPP
jgi:hypothetical protein